MRQSIDADIGVVHYWGGRPQVRTSRFDWHLAILNKCREKGWRPMMVFSSVLENKGIRKALADSNVQCLYVDRPKRQFALGCIRDAYRVFKEVRCSIAHFHCVHTSPIIGAALAGVPVRIWSSHSSEYRDDGQRMSLVHRLGLSTRVTCALAHKVLPVSDSIRKELLGYGIPEDRMSVAPVPIDVSRYVARPEARVSVRRSLGYADHELLVCSVGQATYRKGWDILVRAFAQAVEQVPSMRLLLVGAIATMGGSEPDAYQKDLLALIDNLKVQDRVRLLGVREDVGDVLSASDLFAFPSRAEALGLALLEAMAVGLPCIASSVGGIAEFVHDGDNGLLVEAGNVGMLSDGLVKLAKDERLRGHMGEKSRASLEKFSLDYQASRMLELYEELLGRCGGHFGQGHAGVTERESVADCVERQA